MKLFLVACAFCLAAVSAAPDDLIKLMDPQVIAAAVSAPATPTEAPTREYPSTAQGTVADRTRLLKNLFTDYNNKVNPDDIKLKLGVSLINFDVCENRNVFESYVFLKYKWVDERLQWKPEEYGGAVVVRIPAADVWKPDVTLYNSADPVNMINCWDSNVLLYNTGTLLWVPPCKMLSQCRLDLHVHPYGEQTCSLKFGSWTFDGIVMDLDFYKEKAEVDVSDLSNTSDFEVLSTAAEKHERHYPCCEEPYIDLTFNVTVKRVPGAELYKKLVH